ncbi:beta-13-Galactosyltransferase II [Carabus blaptoides fortunei]
MKLLNKNIRIVSKLDNPAMIILIISSPNNFDRRSTIRDTWLSLHVNKKDDVRMKHYFVVGSIGLSTDTMLHLSSEQSNGNGKIKTQGKWKETDWIICDNYLPYALGGGYVLSQGLVSYLARNSEDLKLYKSEDVSVGAWLAAVANIDRIHDIRFNTEWNSRGCLNLYLVYHKISMSDMKIMFTNIKEQGKPCVEETLRRKHYLYDWNVLPSKCCAKK